MFGCRYNSNCLLVGPGTTGKIPSVGVFLSDPNSYLREFRRKPLKTPNLWVDKCDGKLNPAYYSSPTIPKTSTSNTWLTVEYLGQCPAASYSETLVWEGGAVVWHMVTLGKTSILYMRFWSYTVRFGRMVLDRGRKLLPWKEWKCRMQLQTKNK